MAGEAVRRAAVLARMVLDHADDEMQLDVGGGAVGCGLQEPAGFGEIRSSPCRARLRDSGRTLLQSSRHAPPSDDAEQIAGSGT